MFLLLGKWAAYAAAICGLVFALVHLYAALAGGSGTGRDVDAVVPRPAWFLVYDVIASALFVISGLIALATVQPWGHRISLRLLLILAGGASVVMALRGVIGNALDVSLGATQGALSQALFFDLWFLIEAALLGAAALGAYCQRFR